MKLQQCRQASKVNTLRNLKRKAKRREKASRDKRYAAFIQRRAKTMVVSQLGVTSSHNLSGDELIHALAKQLGIRID